MAWERELIGKERSIEKGRQRERKRNAWCRRGRERKREECVPWKRKMRSVGKRESERESRSVGD